MNDIEFQMLSAELAIRLHIQSRVLSPVEFRNLIYAVVATTVTGLSEDYWKEFSTVKPCGIPGCNCHVQTQPWIIEMYTKMRKEGLATLEQQRQPQRN